MSGRLSGKCVLVTGGGSGIGRAICQIFDREGARIAIVDIDSVAANETLRLLKQDWHIVLKADVTNADDVKRAFENGNEAFGKKFDIVVNNVGIVGQQKALTDLDEEKFVEVINVNLKGIFLVAREYLNSVRSVDKNVRGVLINTSSANETLSPALHGDYSASKAGVGALTKTIANEFAIHRVRCNSVLPGTTQTPILDVVDGGMLDALRETIPMGRFATPEEIAYGFLYLASDESSYVNGTRLEINGGVRSTFKQK